MLADNLLQLGLTSEEIPVYLAVLEMGGGYVSTIARKAKVHRVTCYNTLANLQVQGLITTTKQKGMLWYVAEPPQVLLNQVEEKVELAQKILPELTALHRSSAFTPRIRFFEDKKSILTIFDDMLQAKTEILGYSNLVPLSELFEEVLTRFGKDLLKNHLKSRFLSPYDTENTKLVDKFFAKTIQHGNLEVLCVNPEQFPFKNGVFFYDDKMAIISFDKNELLGVIIQSAVNTQTQKAMFDLAWLGATSFIVR